VETKLAQLRGRGKEQGQTRRGVPAGIPDKTLGKLGLPLGQWGVDGWPRGEKRKGGEEEGAQISKTQRRRDFALKRTLGADFAPSKRF